MQQAVGELIRQLRRQQSLTQTQLGGDQFSKSYVSAVEREKITPSLEALQFFADQLGQPREYFVQLQQQAQVQGREFFSLHGSPRHAPTVQEEFLTVFNSWLEGTEPPVVPLLEHLPTLSADLLASMSAEGQARYAFVRGLLALQQQDVSTALQAFEQALGLAPPHYQPAILDHLGTCYWLAHLYQTALGYHQRALRLLQDSPEQTSTTLRFHVELHCGNACRALGLYEQARTHYERGRQYLKATHDLKTAGLLYLGLGYCTYAQAYEQAATPFSPTTPLSELEGHFQRAISYLVQSRTLYQVSADQSSESSVRLVQAMVLLDLVALRRHSDLQRTAKTTPPTGVNSLTLLQEAHEQCHQVLLGWQEACPTGEPSAPPEPLLSTALAYLVRIATQRGALARLEGYADTASRERALAAHLCQHVLDSLSDPALVWTLLGEVLHLRLSQLEYHAPSLPRLPDLSAQGVSPLAQLEVFWAAAEVAEELGRAATTQDYALDCYRQADLCFQTALTVAHSIQPDEEHDPGSVLRYYQRCLHVLEERMQVFPEGMEATIKTLLDILKTGLAQLQHSFIQ